MNTIVVHCNAMLPIVNDEASFLLTLPTHVPGEYKIKINKINDESRLALEHLQTADKKLKLNLNDTKTTQAFKLLHVNVFEYTTCCLCKDDGSFLTCTCVTGRVIVTHKTNGHQSLRTLDQCTSPAPGSINLSNYLFGGIVQNWYATAWSSASFIVALHGRCRVLTENGDSTDTTTRAVVTFSDNVEMRLLKYARFEPCCEAPVCGNSVFQNSWHVRLSKA